MFINTATCQMFRKQTEVITETAPDYSGQTTTVTEFFSPYPYPATKTTTYVNDGARFSCPVSQRQIYDSYTNAAGFGYKYNCGNPDRFWAYDATYSNPVTVQELGAKQRQLESYTVQNWEQLVSAFVVQVKYNENYQPITSGSNISSQHFCTSNTADIFNFGTGRGWAGTTTSLYPLTTTTGQWQESYIRFVSWFSKVRLTRNYRTKAFQVTTETGPGYCSAITSMRFFGGDGVYGTSPSARFICLDANVQEYSDGYDENNQPRSVIFGPVNAENHMLLVQCVP